MWDIEREGMGRPWQHDQNSREPQGTTSDVRTTFRSCSCSSAGTDLCLSVGCSGHGCRHMLRMLHVNRDVKLCEAHLVLFRAQGSWHILTNYSLACRWVKLQTNSSGFPNIKSMQKLHESFLWPFCWVMLQVFTSADPMQKCGEQRRSRWSQGALGTRWVESWVRKVCGGSDGVRRLRSVATWCIWKALEMC